MKKLLIIDRDGTLIKEVPVTHKIDGFDKLEFYTDVFFYLRKIAMEFNFELLMVTNQDGLGTADFPEEKFLPVHAFIIQCFENEQIHFSEVLIDKTYPNEHADTRKPNTGLLKNYISNPNYDMAGSFVIGDRITDVQLAKNLGCKAFWLNNGGGLGMKEISDSLEVLQKTAVVDSPNWKAIYSYLLQNAASDGNS